MSTIIKYIGTDESWDEVTKEVRFGYATCIDGARKVFIPYNEDECNEVTLSKGDFILIRNKYPLVVLSESIARNIYGDLISNID